MTARDDMTAAERDDLSELAALLNEIRVTWRPLDWPARDWMRRLVLEGLYRFRAQQDRPGTAPEDCPWDVSGLVDAPREQLLHLLKIARFNEVQLRGQLAGTKAGIARERADAEAAVARCASLLDHRRKAVPMGSLKAALYPEMTP